MTRLVLFAGLVVLSVALVACEGDQGPAGPAGPRGPAGPTVLLAWGNANNSGTLQDSGPAGVIVTTTRTAEGVYACSTRGTFPTDRGVLVASATAAGGDITLDQFAAGWIDSWTDSLIAVTIETYDLSLGVRDDEDFTFVLLGE